MSVPNSATRQPAPYSPLRALVARHPAVAFLVLAFWFGWTSLIPILLSENGFGLLPIELPLTVIQNGFNVQAVSDLREAFSRVFRRANRSPPDR
jgi:hypothetical protein